MPGMMGSSGGGAANSLVRSLLEITADPETFRARLAQFDEAEARARKAEAEANARIQAARDAESIAKAAQVSTARACADLDAQRNDLATRVEEFERRVANWRSDSEVQREKLSNLSASLDRRRAELEEQHNKLQAKHGELTDKIKETNRLAQTLSEKIAAAEAREVEAAAKIAKLRAAVS